MPTLSPLLGFFYWGDRLFKRAELMISIMIPMPHAVILDELDERGLIIWEDDIENGAVRWAEATELVSKF